jgi:GT2 family glycosyltransferase
LVSIVIPTYNGIEHLKICIDSLLKQTIRDFKIILTDNGSSDGSDEFVKKEYPDIEIIKLEKNFGFAKAVNIGIKKSLSDSRISHIVLLNNDVECDKCFLEELLNGFISKDIGSVTGKMMNYFERNKIDDAGNFIKMIGSPFARGFGEIDNGQYDSPEFIFGACAGASVIKREVFETICLFDEDFFAYYEDVDFSFRAQFAGFKCYYNPKAVCYHKHGATTSSDPGWKTMMCEKNLIALRVKNYPLSLYIKLQPLFFVGRLKRYFDFLIDHSFKVFLYALKGYLLGLIYIPKLFRKRKHIQMLQKVSKCNFYSITKH